MPDELAHRRRGEQNEAFAQEISKLNSPVSQSCAVVALFYAAPHYVQARLSLTGVEIYNHTVRASGIKRDPVLKYIWTDYDWLYQQSRIARYHFHSHMPYERLLPHLARIKQQAARGQSAFQA